MLVLIVIWVDKDRSTTGVDRIAGRLGVRISDLKWGSVQVRVGCVCTAGEL